MAFLFGPLLGGLFVDTTSWRLVFAINILPIAITLWLMRSMEQTDHPKEHVPVDVVGALLCVLGLGGVVYGLIEQSRLGWSNMMIQFALFGGAILLGLFMVYERSRAKHPMLPLQLFSVRNFSVGNVATMSIYAGLSIATFLLAVFVQQVGGYSALQAGLALMPVTLIMFILSPRFGALAGKYGPRWFMASGPLVAAVGFLLMQQVDERVLYVSQLLPGILVFGVGLAMTVSPLTSAVLGAIESHQAGIASAVNNMIARVAGLIGIALIGVVVGSQLSVTGFHSAALVTALLLLIGGVVSAIGIQNLPPKSELPTEV
jgi:MFS family permease